MTDIIFRVYVTAVGATIIFLLTISYFDPRVISNDVRPDSGNLVYSSADGLLYFFREELLLEVGGRWYVDTPNGLHPWRKWFRNIRRGPY